MKFGVSNLAFGNNDKQAKNLLDSNNIKYIEVAPTLICPWEQLTPKVLRDYELEMNKKIISIQSLLYGTNISSTDKNQSRDFIKHMKSIIDICENLEIPKIVFGSPKNRSVNSNEEHDTFINNFRHLGDYCKNVVICIEPNAREYGCNFMTTIKETMSVIEAIDSENVKLHIDTGCMMMESENPDIIYSIVSQLYSVHISDRGLGKIVSLDYHSKVSRILECVNYNGIITLETVSKDLQENITTVFEIYKLESKKMALIGHTGFVGSHLKRQMFFDSFYNSKNIYEIKSFDTIYCCGAPGTKWLANQDPEADFASISNLIENLKKIQCRKFILISTIDVYGQRCGNERNKPIPYDAYGRHRLHLEHQIQEIFENTSIFRLSGLYGDNLKKNIIFDLKNNHRIGNINPLNSFQWYNISNLCQDIIQLSDEFLVNLVNEPIMTGDLSPHFKYNTRTDTFNINYNVSSLYYCPRDRQQVLKEILELINK